MQCKSPSVVVCKVKCKWQRAGAAVSPSGGGNNVRIPSVRMSKHEIKW